MFMLTENKLNPCCVKVPKIFDWVNKSTFIKLKEKVKLEPKKDVSDFLCCDFQVPCGAKERTTLWTTSGLNRIGGSICISFTRGCGIPLEVYINGMKAGEVEEDSSFIATYSDLCSVEVICKGSKEALTYCMGEFKITLHYEPDLLCKVRSFQDIKHINCFLSDCNGKPVSMEDRCSIICQILTPAEERTTFEFLTPKGKPVKLQRIDLLKQGFVTVEFFNEEKQLCLQCVFPFSEVETVFICAPKGTEIECEITSVECKAFAIPPIDKCCNSIELAITILLCQSISSVADVKLEILAKNCKPRDEFKADFCPPIEFPISCPIFPEKTPSS